MKKLYPRICSNCGRRFLGKKMDYRCAICVENQRVTVEERELANSELGTIMRIETRGQRCIGWRSAGHISRNG